LGQREKQRNPVCRRKSKNLKPKQERRSPLPGRPAKLALLCAKRTGKSLKIAEKQACLFYRKFSGFSYARKLAWRHASYRRKLFVIASKPVRRLASLQLSSPGRKRVLPLPPNSCLPNLSAEKQYPFSRCKGGFFVHDHQHAKNIPERPGMFFLILFLWDSLPVQVNLLHPGHRSGMHPQWPGSS